MTVLAGPVEIAQWVWSSWLRRNRRRTISTSAPCDCLVWLDDGDVRETVARRLAAQVCAAESTTLDEVRAAALARGNPERAAWLQRLAILVGRSADIVAWSISHPTVRSPLSSLSENARFEAVSVMARPSPEPAPAWIVLVPNELHTLTDAVGAVLRFSEKAPRLSVALAVPSTALRRWLDTGTESRAKAMIREGVLDLRPSHAVDSPVHGRDESRSIAYSETAFLRSIAERCVYEELERNPDTRSLFEPNGELDCEFGSGPAEIDLLCRKLRVAVEIDGYHHFRDAEAYRRDRRKDLLLQKQGYLVVRVLAADVPDNMDFVLARVREALEWRKKEEGEAR